jgi:PLP dependent protein
MALFAPARLNVCTAPYGGAGAPWLNSLRARPPHESSKDIQDMTSIPTIEENLVAVRARLSAAIQKAGRRESEVTLVAVSKTQPVTAVRAALAAGQREFGENRIQEAIAKFPVLRTEFSDMRLHLIGPLQTNKAVDAVRTFDVIQSLDRPKLAAVLANAMSKLQRRPDCYIQVNTGEEPQKAGIAPSLFDSFLAECRDRYKLPIVGLMCIPPAHEAPGPHFAQLRDLARRHGLAQLSMGMSGDFETAVGFGATAVRVGTAIFGARPSASPESTVA